MSRKELLEKMIEANYSMYYFLNKDIMVDATNVKMIEKDLDNISKLNFNLAKIHFTVLTEEERIYLMRINAKRFCEVLNLLCI